MVTSIIHLLSNRATASSDLLSPSPPSSSYLILSPPFSPVSPPQDPRRFSRAFPNCETIREKTLYPHRAGPSDSNEHSPGLYFKFVIAGFGTTSEKKKEESSFLSKGVVHQGGGSRGNLPFPAAFSFVLRIPRSNRK